MSTTLERKITPLDRLLRPRSIAIVGASAKQGSLGASLLANLTNANFSGELHLVNPKGGLIDGRACLGSVDELPDGVDCAVLAIPGPAVLETVRACARRNVGACIIFSAGFAESGESGRLEQAELTRIAETSGMAIEGPNCLGLVNYVDRIPLTFVNTPMPAETGKRCVAILSQSGAMAAVLGVALRHQGLDLSFSVSTGNEAAAGIEEFLEYMLEDDATQVIAMIVEQFRKPQRLLALAARATSLGKQIVLLHPGSSSGARASAATHTGAMAGDYKVMRTKVHAAGVIVADTLEEMADIAQISALVPALPSGGTAVFGESGAFKALTLDFCDRLRLSVPPLSEATAAELRKALPAFIPPTNPMDLTAQGLVDPDLYRRTLPPILMDPSFGTVVLAIILTDVATSSLKLPPVLSALRDIKPTKPVIFAGLDEGAAIPQHYVEELRALGVPFFPTTERAFRAVSAITKRATPAATIGGNAPVPISKLSLRSGVIPEFVAKRILVEIGIPVPLGEAATNVEGAIAIAERLGYPVALKAQSSDLSHKSDAGGVALHISDAASLAAAWQKMLADVARVLPADRLEAILVEKMGERGTELIVGAHRDKDWGAVLLIGFGGVAAEVLDDFRLLVPEATHEDVLRELNQLKGAALLHGFRGSPALDVDALAAVVVRLGGFMLAHREVQSVDINPLVVYPRGGGAVALVALDALIVTDAE